MFWIDAVYINQKDVDERIAQMQLMAEIYRDAEVVVAWLGERDEESEMAFKFVREISEPSRRDGLWKEHAEKFDLDPAELITQHFAEDPIPLGVYSQSALNFRRILNSMSAPEIEVDPVLISALSSTFSFREWWHRKWIVQEVFFARTIRIVCCRMSFQWREICNVLKQPRFVALRNPKPKRMSLAFGFANFLDTSRHPKTILEAAAQHEERYGTNTRAKYVNYPVFIEEDKVGEREYLELPYALVTFSNWRCSDPRDIIYSLLNICKFRDNSLIADYSKSPDEVFIEATKFPLLELRSLSYVMTLDGWGHHPQGSHKNLPSWVLDFPRRTDRQSTSQIKCFWVINDMSSTRISR
jgi:hypothetical protein